MGAREDLGRDLAAAAATPAGLQTVSATVVDVTDTGTVNLDLGGALLLDVPCTDAYRGRQPGDTVAVRRGSRPVVLWRLGPDPGQLGADDVREIALDAQALSSATWGTAAPAGSGWQGPVTLYMRKNSDGQVELYGQLGAETDPSPPASGRPPRPATITPTASGSWRGGRPDDYRDTPTQGDWTGRGNVRGAWFYGTAIAAACSGKTVAKMTVQFTRKRGSGANARRPMHLYLHNHSSPPSGQLNLGDGPEELLSLSVGATGTATLPSSWRTALASGSAKGLAIYAHGSRDYLAATGGKVTITYS